MQIIRGRRGRALALAAASLSLTASTFVLAAPSGAAELQTVNYVLEWVPNPDFTGLYYAIHHGYFAAEGLKVNLTVNDDGGVPALVGTNKDDLGNGSTSGQIAAHLAGIPVTSVSEFMSGMTDALIISGKSGITSLKGLVGKKVGYYSATSLKTFDFLMKKNGIDPSSISTTQVGDAIVPSLVSGKVDAIMGGLTNVEAIQIGETMHKRPLVYVLSSQGEPAHPEFTIMANTGRLATDAKYRAMIKKFVKAYVKGEQGAQADVAGAVNIMEKETSYTPSFLKNSVPVTLKALSPIDSKKWACFSLPEMQKAVNWYASTAITTGVVVAKENFTNAYLPWSC